MRRQWYSWTRCNVDHATMVADHVASSFKSRTVQIDSIEETATTFDSNEATLEAPGLHAYAEVVSCLLKRCVHDEVIPKADMDILIFTQPASMTALQYRKPLPGKAICLWNFYKEGKLNDTFIEKINVSIRCSLRWNWVINCYADLTNLPFQAQSYWPSKASQPNKTTRQKFSTDRDISGWERHKSTSKNLPRFQQKSTVEAIAVALDCVRWRQ